MFYNVAFKTTQHKTVVEDIKYGGGLSDSVLWYFGSLITDPIVGMTQNIEHFLNISEKVKGKCH